MRTITILFMYLSFSLFSAAQTYKVDVSRAISKEIPMSHIMNDMKVIDIKLPDSLQLKDVVVELTHDGEYLIVSSPYEGPYMFDVKGNFIKTIKPTSVDCKQSEVKYLNSHFNAKKNIFYEDFFDHWIGIDVRTNKIVERKHKPEQFKNRLTSFMQISDNEYIGYSNDTTGGYESYLAFFDSCGQILHQEPNLEPYTYGSKYPRGPFCENNSRYYFVDPYLGTKIYEITGRKLLPYIYFETRNVIPDNDKLSYVVETEDRIYFSFSAKDNPYWGYYNKNENQAYIASNSGRAIASKHLDKENFFPSFVQGRQTVTSGIEGNMLKVIIGTLK